MSIKFSRMLGVSSLGAVTAYYRAFAEKVLTEPAKRVTVLSRSGREQRMYILRWGKGASIHLPSQNLHLAFWGRLPSL